MWQFIKYWTITILKFIGDIPPSIIILIILLPFTIMMIITYISFGRDVKNIINSNLNFDTHRISTFLDTTKNAYEEKYQSFITEINKDINEEINSFEEELQEINVSDVEKIESTDILQLSEDNNG